MKELYVKAYPIQGVGKLANYWATDVTARAELWDGLWSIPSDSVSLASFLYTPYHHQENKREEGPLQPPNRLTLCDITFDSNNNNYVVCLHACLCTCNQLLDSLKVAIELSGHPSLNKINQSINQSSILSRNVCPVHMYLLRAE